MGSRKHEALAVAGAAVGVGLAVRSWIRSRRRINLAGQRILITGGSRGFGLVLARQLANRGARVILCAREEDELADAKRQLDRMQRECHLHVCDVTDREQVQQMVADITRDLGGIDIVINNAGIIQSGPDQEMTLADFEQSMQTHFYGPMNVNDAVLPQMRERGWGRIVNVSSIGGVISIPHLLPYCSSKFALVGYSTGLRQALAKEGILVTTVCPGLMRTGSPRNATFKGKNELEYTLFKIASSIPILTMNAERAAAGTIRALEYGDPFLILGAPMKAAALLHSVFPGLASEALARVDQLLPGPGGIGRREAYGRDSETSLSQSWLTALTQKAALKNNELTCSDRENQSRYALSPSFSGESSLECERTSRNSSMLGGFTRCTSKPASCVFRRSSDVP